MMIDIQALKEAVGQGGQKQADLFWFYVLGGCGCGTSDELADKAWTLFEAFHDAYERDPEPKVEAHWLRAIYDAPELEVMAHWMDSLGLIEHGGSIIWSWTTDIGDEVWDIIQWDE